MGNRHSNDQNNELKHIQQINRNDYLYIFGANPDGGGEILIFDAHKESFFQAQPPIGMNIIDYMGIIKVSNQLIYLSGGINKTKNSISDELIEYNPITNSYCYLGRMKHSRFTHCLTYKSSKLYAIGGRTYGEGMNGLLASCEVYDFISREWKEIASLSMPRCTFFTFQYLNQIYVCGGFNGNKRRTELIERYCENEDKWETIDMKLNRGIECGSLHVLETSRDEFVIFGGNLKEGGTNECWRYNLKKKKSDLIGKMLNKRVLQKSIVTSKHCIYILGGDQEPKTDKDIKLFKENSIGAGSHEINSVDNNKSLFNFKNGQNGSCKNIELENNSFDQDIKKQDGLFQRILKSIDNKEESSKNNNNNEKQINNNNLKDQNEQYVQRQKAFFQENINNNKQNVNQIIKDKQTIEKSSFLSYSLQFERLYSREQEDLFNKRSYQNWKNYSQAHEIQIILSDNNNINNPFLEQKKSIENKYNENNNQEFKRRNSFGDHANQMLKNLFYGKDNNKNDDESNKNNISLEEQIIPMQQQNQQNNSMDIEDEYFMQLRNFEENVEIRQQRAVSLSQPNYVISQLIQGCSENINNYDNRAQPSSVESDDLIAQMQNDHNLLLNTFIDNNNFNNINNHQNNQRHNNQSPFNRRFYLFGTSENQDFIAEIDVLTQDLRKKIRPKKLKLLSYRSGVRFEESESILICGGVNDEMSKISNSVYMYYPNEDKVESLKPMHTRRYTFCCVKKGNYVYALGGRSYGNDEAAIMSKCERYNITTKEWEVIASMKYRRCSFMASCLENKLYVVGGYGGSNIRQSSFECYHETENRWELMGIELIEPIEASTLLNIATHDHKKILILGGRSTKDDRDSVYSYDIQHGFDAFQGQLSGTMTSKRCLHKQIPLNHDSTTFLLLGGFTKGERISAYSFNPTLNQIKHENKEFITLINKIDNFLFKDLQTKDTTLRRNLLL